MMKDPKFIAGFKAGVASKTKEYNSIVENDLTAIYGIMCVALKERGDSDDEMTRMIERTQELWNEVTESGKNVNDFVVEKTGLDIVQMLT